MHINIRSILSSFLFCFSFLVFLIPPVFAGQYLSDDIHLSFTYDDVFSVRDFTSEFNASQPATLQANRYILIGSNVQSSDNGVFEIFIGDMSLITLVNDLQLRFINTDTLSNKDFLSTTSVEITGTSFSSLRPVVAIAFVRQGKSVFIIYNGEDSNQFASFLESITEPGIFSDVLPDYPFLTEINDVAERKIFLGYKNNLSGAIEFRPDKSINRAEFLKVITLSAPGIRESTVNDFYLFAKPEILDNDDLVSSDSDPDTLPVFPDVDRDSWFAPYVFYAFDQGWVKGYPDGTFRPNQTIILPEAVKLLLRSRDVSLVSDSDLWFRPFLNYLSKRNVLVGKYDSYGFPFTDSVINISQSLTRSHTAALLSRIIWLDEHPKLPFFAREIPIDVLPFGLSLPSDSIIYELGSVSGSSDIQNTYNVLKKSTQKNEFLFSIRSFYPEYWTNLELKTDLTNFSKDFVYIGENRKSVFAYDLNCDDFYTCTDISSREKLLESFFIRKQDLIVFDELNLGLSFLHSLEIKSISKRDGDTQALRISSPDDKKLIVLNVLSNTMESADFFGGINPEKNIQIGNRDWYQYSIREENKKQLRLITSIGSDKIVATIIDGIDDISFLNPKFLRMLRTLSLRE